MKKKTLPLLWLILFLGATCGLAQAGSTNVTVEPGGTTVHVTALFSDSPLTSV